MAAYDDWAEYYDLIHTGLPGEAEFYVSQAVRVGGRALELGCGTGRIAIPIAMCGIDVTGLDNSEPMLEICRDKIEAVGKTPGTLELVCADMTDFSLDTQFDYIAMPYRTFMHLLTQDDQRRCLACVHRHLKDGGVFILNVWAATPSAIVPNLGPDDGALEFAGRYTIPGSEDSVLNHHSVSYDEFTQVLVEQHLLQEIDGDGAVLRTTTLPLVRTWLTLREMDNLVRLCGFQVDALFGDFDCTPFSKDSTEMIWALKKTPTDS